MKSTSSRPAGGRNGDEAVDASREWNSWAEQYGFNARTEKRVQVSGKMMRCGEAWEEQSVALLDYITRILQDVWWFQTLCERCHPMISAHTQSTGLQSERVK